MIGKMRSKVTVTSWTNTKDDAGGNIATELAQFNLFAEAKRITGRDYSGQGQPDVLYDFKFKVRYYPSQSITTSNTVTYNNQLFSINRVETVIESKLTFLVLYCTVLSDAAQSAGGGGGGGTISINSTQGTVEAPTGDFFTYTVDQAIGAIWLQYLLESVVIDWGDGAPIMRYPANCLLSKTYTTAGPFDIKVYYGANLTDIWLQTNGIGELLSITGTIPPAVQRLQVSGNLPTLPTLPASCIFIKVYNCSLEVSELNSLIDFCIAGGATGGYLRMKNQNPAAVPTNLTGIQTLINRGWAVDSDE